MVFSLVVALQIRSQLGWGKQQARSVVLTCCNQNLACRLLSFRPSLGRARPSREPWRPWYRVVGDRLSSQTNTGDCQNAWYQSSLGHVDQGCLNMMLLWREEDIEGMSLFTKLELTIPQAVNHSINNHYNTESLQSVSPSKCESLS